MISFLASCISMLASRSPRTLVLTIVAALLLAGGCWWVCTNYYQLWNKRFQIGVVHQAFCALAALMTLVFTLVFVSMRYTGEITQNAIDKWHTKARADRRTIDDAFRRGYAAVKASGLEDFSNVPPVDANNRYIPVTSVRTGEIASKAYVDSVTDDFRTKNSFLLRVLALPEAPLSAIQADRDVWRRSQPGVNYPMMRAVDFTATHIRNALVPQAPKTVSYVRGMAVGMLLLFQAIPFALIGYSSYKDLKVQR